jgi:hypothetical protein
MMKKQLAFILLTTFLTTMLCFPVSFAQISENSKDSWVSFAFPKKLDPASPANIGKLVLDPPAGKHGFVKVKDGHFYFEDGTRARFWGTNLCFAACFPSKEQAEILADRLAFFGFNAVRLHHMDYFFEPHGIFEDISPAYKNSQLKQTGVLSKKQLNKLDYLIYQLKKRGIYIDMNLLVSRHFTEADGVKDAKKFGMAAKPVSMFDPNLIELQKKYAKGLLSHYNTCTKLRYCDDPAVALVEIINENSIVRFWKHNHLNGTLFGFKKNSIPEHYVTQLDLLWNEWLKKKYGTVDRVKTAWNFLSGARGEGRGARPVVLKNGWKLEKHSIAGATVSNPSNNTAIIAVKNVTNTPWHLQYRTSGIEISQDKKYLLTFTVSTKKNSKIAIVLQQSSSPWKVFDRSNGILISPTLQTFQIPLVPKEDCADTKIAFIVGFSPGTITLKNISFKEIDSLPFVENERTLSIFKFSRPFYKFLRFYPKQEQTDIAQFYENLEKDYFDEMVLYLKQECGVQVPITGSQFSSSSAQMSCDFIDTHAYWDHPRFPNKSWNMNDFRIHNRSMLKDKKLGIIGNILRKQKAADSSNEKPFTVTEWDHCYPNRYAYETPVLLAAEAVKNDWDALFQFAFTHGGDFSAGFSNIHSYFDIIANSQQLILCSLGSLIFHNAQVETATQNDVFKLNSLQVKGIVGFIKDKAFEVPPLTITSRQNGTVFLYSPKNKPIEDSTSLILVAISEVKNKNSFWKNKRFNWGTKPTMLKNMDIEISLPSDKEWEIHEIAPDGTKGKPIKTFSRNGRLTFSTKNSASLWFEIISR